MFVTVIFHRFTDVGRRERYVRTTRETAVALDSKKFVPGRRARVDGLIRRVLAVGYEGQTPVIHVAR